MYLLIDNYDSFTYNISQYLGELGVKVQVLRNDQIKVNNIFKNFSPNLVTIICKSRVPSTQGLHSMQILTSPIIKWNC